MSQSICSFDGCGDDVAALGLCSGHYMQQHLGKPLTPKLNKRKSTETCTFPSCGRGAYGYTGWCSPHYQQVYRGSEPKPLKIKWHSLREKMEHYLEPDENGCWIWQLSLVNGYGRVQWKGRYFQVHRQLWLELGREIPEGLELDHLCRVRACANPDHLEPVTHLENMLRSPYFQGPGSRQRAKEMGL